jgi:unsaturated rhamnogalacturonyl hydrolase
MVNSIKNILFFLMLVPGFLPAQERGALEVVRSVSDRIIKDTQFELELVKKYPVLGVQIIDFNLEAGSSEGIFYAHSYIHCCYDTTVKIGISASENISIFVNNNALEFRRSGAPSLAEIAYGMINFDDSITIDIKKGVNIILVKAEQPSVTSKLFLRQIPDNPDSAGFIKFDTSPQMDSGMPGWLIAGPFNSKWHDSPEVSIKHFYSNSKEFLNWRLPREYLAAQLKIDPDNVFKRDSYADWNYANGETLLSILDLARTTENSEYYDFVKQWCDFIISHIPYFRYQYDSLNILRGSYHRIFRKSMLDDAGAPVLPFVQLYLDNRNENYRSLIDEMAEYVVNDQVRLIDGTFCRPEPVELTVWADDLFMSVPLLLRMGKITDNIKYYEDAVNQIINFSSLLYDKDKGLYKHGWFSKTDQTSIAFWGRANGWVMWALSEALLLLPENEHYSKVMTIYKNLVNGLVKHQGKNGMWHQVLDHPESYEESSCTAMFILGIARGVNYGWLDASYAESALTGWNALVKRIEPEGIVKGICRGTGIGNDLEFYFKRPTLDNDPRGLGAVITAGIEISKLEKKITDYESK